MMKIKTLKGKLISITLALFFVVLLSSTAAVAFFVKGQMETVLLNKSIETATEMSQNITNMLSAQQAKTEDLQAFLAEKSKQKNIAYAVIIDKNAVAIAHSDAAKIGKQYDDAYTLDGAKNGNVKTSRFFADMQQIWTYDIMVPIYKNGTQVGALDIGIPETGITEVIYKIVQIQTILSVIFFLVISLLLAGVFHRMFMPLNDMVQIINKIGQLDLKKDGRLDRLVGNTDEIGEIARSLSSMQASVAALVKEIINNSQSLSSSSTMLSSTVKHLSDKVVVITDSVQDISSQMQEASAATEEITASIEEVEANINVLSQKAANGSDNAVDFKDRAQNAQKNSRQAIDESMQILAEKKADVEKAIATGRVVENIKVMADTIAGISAQTNLLALNAAIEAARAGEQGRGFAVVAEEVRKLAEQSGKSVLNIQETIDQVQVAFKSSTDTGTGMLDFIDQDVQKNFAAYGDTGRHYAEDAEFVSRMSEEIARMSEDVNHTVSEVSKAIQVMTGNTQKSNEHTKTISDNMDETTAVLKNVADTAGEQAQLAANLNDMVRKFKV
ncbi:MAG: methyl-accepting chemotaxis protein [Selenomonadaceae bacterium]